MIMHLKANRTGLVLSLGGDAVVISMCGCLVAPIAGNGASKSAATPKKGLIDQPAISVGMRWH